MSERESPQWKVDSLHWRGRILTGEYGHWCDDWDGLPIDETCPEWPCACAGTLMLADRIKDAREKEDGV